MRRLSYFERIKQFIENMVIVDQYSRYSRSTEHTLEEKVGDIREIWSSVTNTYLNRMGLGGVEPYADMLDCIKMHVVNMPVFQITTSIEPYEVRSFRVEDKVFTSKEDIINYLSENLIAGYEIFLYTIDKMTMVNPYDMQPTTRWMLRVKVVDWDSLDNLNVKIDFTPRKRIPKLTMDIIKHSFTEQ